MNSYPSRIESASEYDAALARIADLMSKDLHDDDARLSELDILSRLVEHYEKEQFPFPNQ